MANRSFKMITITFEESDFYSVRSLFVQQSFRTKMHHPFTKKELNFSSKLLEKYEFFNTYWIVKMFQLAWNYFTMSKLLYSWFCEVLCVRFTLYFCCLTECFSIIVIWFHCCIIFAYTCIFPSWIDNQFI